MRPIVFVSVVTAAYAAPGFLDEASHFEGIDMLKHVSFLPTDQPPINTFISLAQLEGGGGGYVYNETNVTAPCAPQPLGYGPVPG